jgi:succinate-semialdehyde dehydrogenase/glutarate-semialdehyde dehydrogenase
MRFEIIEPSTGRVVDVIPGHGGETVERRLDETHRVQKSWAATAPEERARLLERLAALLDERADEMAVRMAREMGKPVAQGIAEARKCALVARYYADHGPAWCADERVDVEEGTAFVRHDPLGVILGVMPWNFPYWQVFRFAVPAVMGGNAVILKHAPSVGGIAQDIESLMIEAGFPRALLHTLFVNEETTADVLRDRRIAAVTLTGSERAGGAVARVAGSVLKKCVLELGGSDPFIVLGDADIDRAARVGAWSRLLNAGQSCIAAKRFIVHQDVADRFVEALRSELEKVSCDDPYDPATRLGPMARKDLRRGLHGQVRRSQDLGARVVLGAEVPEGPAFAYPPTLLVDAGPGMPVWDEETFGPVAAVRVVRDDAEALEEGNRTSYGLGASVWTQDAERATPFVDGLACGAVFVNEMTKSDPRLPFGGVGRSGYGRELARDGVMEWLNRKSVWIAP